MHCAKIQDPVLWRLSRAPAVLRSIVSTKDGALLGAVCNSEITLIGQNVYPRILIFSDRSILRAQCMIYIIEIQMQRFFEIFTHRVTRSTLQMYTGLHAPTQLHNDADNDADTDTNADTDARTRVKSHPCPLDVIRYFL